MIVGYKVWFMLSVVLVNGLPMFQSNLRQKIINTHVPVVQILSNFDNFLDKKNYKKHA